jgi:hypothetical protein
MVDPRIAQIAAEEEERKRKTQEDAIERDKRIKAFDDFAREWKAVFPTEGSLTPEIAISIAANYMSLADGIRERMWDFHVAELLQTQSIRSRYEEVALRLLGYACCGNVVEVRDCLTTSAGFIVHVVRQHESLYEKLLLDVGVNGLPFTPLLNSTEMHKLLGITYNAFRWAKDNELWKTHPDDPPGKHKHRWRHTDPAIQQHALEKIRERSPKKIWGAFG